MRERLFLDLLKKPNGYLNLLVWFFFCCPIDKYAADLTDA
jgi:hypothetical protein